MKRQDQNDCGEVEERPQTKIISYDDIEYAFMYVSSDAPFMHSVILCMETGKMYYMSEMGDSDEVPDDIDDVKRYISIPHKNDLELGSKLVFDFTAAYLPEDLDSVYTMFRRRGAYFRFRRLLESRGLLQSWYDYENQRTKTALLEWCVYSGIDVKE